MCTSPLGYMCSISPCSLTSPPHSSMVRASIGQGKRMAWAVSGPPLMSQGLEGPGTVGGRGVGALQLEESKKVAK